MIANCKLQTANCRGLEAGTEPVALGGETRVEARGAVAVAARPRLGAIAIAAPAGGVGGLHLLQRAVSLPVVSLLLEPGRAVADLDPLHAAVLELSRGR